MRRGNCSLSIIKHYIHNDTMLRMLNTPHHKDPEYNTTTVQILQFNIQPEIPVYCNRSSVLPGFLSLNSHLLSVDMRVSPREMCFPAVLFIDNLCPNLQLHPRPLPLLSVHPFLFWWRPAQRASVSTGTQVNSDLPLCLSISCVFQVQRAVVQTGINRGRQLGVNQIWTKL